MGVATRILALKIIVWASKSHGFPLSTQPPHRLGQKPEKLEQSMTITFFLPPSHLWKKIYKRLRAPVDFEPGHLDPRSPSVGVLLSDFCSNFLTHDGWKPMEKQIKRGNFLIYLSTKSCMNYMVPGFWPMWHLSIGRFVMIFQIIMECSSSWCWNPNGKRFFITISVGDIWVFDDFHGEKNDLFSVESKSFMIKSPSVFGFSSTSHLFCWSFFLRSESEADKSDLESESEEACVDGFSTARGRFFSTAVVFRSRPGTKRSACWWPEDFPSGWTDSPNVNIATKNQSNSTEKHIPKLTLA